MTYLSRRALLFSSLKALCGLVCTSLLPARRVLALEGLEALPWASEADGIIKLIARPNIQNNTHVTISKLPGGSDARPIIQSAIDLVSGKGGGRVIIPSGEWFVRGPLRLRSGVDLHLSRGSRLTFSDDPKDYLPPAFTRWEGTEAFSLSAYIYAHAVKNVSISGTGIINGNGISARKRGMLTSGLAQDRLRSMGQEGVPLAQRIFEADQILPPSLIQFIECEAVSISGVRVIDMPFWGIHLVYSRDVVVDSVTIESNSNNNDGIDIDSSQRVYVHGCTFSTGDDCIAIKSGRDLDGRMIGRPSEDIVIDNCHMKEGRAAGVGIGSEMSGGVRRVFVSSCKMDKVSMALHIKSNLDRGGYVEHIRMGRVVVDSCDAVIDVTTMYHGYRGGRFNPQFKDIHIDKVWCHNADVGIEVDCSQGALVSDMRVRDLTVDWAKKTLVTVNPGDLTLERVTMNGRETGL